MNAGFRRSPGTDVFRLFADGKPIAEIVPQAHCTDSFTQLEDGVWYWQRRSDTPVSEMRMELLRTTEVTFTMIPGVSYNGNGWGDSAEYVGGTDGGIPWTFVWHRCTIPACTYTEADDISLALLADPSERASCSLWSDGSGTARHALVWPEQEGPRVLMRHEWAPPFRGTMEPRTEFRALIVLSNGGRARQRYEKLLTFAWKRFSHPLRPSMPAADLYRYTLAFFKSLWTHEPSGFCAFNRGLDWNSKTCYYEKRTSIRYEIGWVGQNALLSCILLEDYLKTGDTECRDKAILTLDSWIRCAVLPNGLMRVKFDGDPAASTPPDTRAYMPELASQNGHRVFPIDACNLGGAASGLFEAADLAEKAGVPRPEYRETALGICRFVVRHQSPDGAFAKSWNDDGSVQSQNGSVGSFLICPLLTAYQRTTEPEFLESAKAAFDFYYGEFDRNGFTTAGALDTYCIDKESASPLLAAALALYAQTRDAALLQKAQNVAWYLCTWMMHYRVEYSKDTVCGQIGYDTFGMTAVSTAHNAIDQYAVHDVLSFFKLAELTGNSIWQRYALAFWCSTTQLVSDGTLSIAGHVRPAGSQDEAVYHTRWSRRTLGPYQPTQWLVAWSGAFRMDILRKCPDWRILDCGTAAEPQEVRE